MAESYLNESLPDLREIESKVGRKTPESLLVWMKDAAAEREETLCCGLGNDNLFDADMSAKITNLKQEMRWLRSTDVRILRQLMAVHEGIEAMRWLVEERGASGSQSSSLTGSLSSLITIDEPGLSFSRYRDSMTSPHDLTEDTEEDLDLQLHRADPSKNYLSSDYSSERNSTIFSVHKFEVSPSPRLSRSQHFEEVESNPVRSALLRSRKVSRREEKSKMNSSNKDYSGEFKIAIESPNLENNRTKGDQTEQEDDKMLLGYDAQWCWVESQDDVTFL